MGFSAVDYVVLLLYLVGITIFGMMFRRTQRTVKDYFIGAKNTHWLVISLSIVATETSTLTLIGVPAIAYSTLARPEQGGNFTYLQVYFGYMLTLVYTFEGGIAAVIWTDLIQLVIYIGGSLLAAYELLHLVPGGWPAVAAHAAETNKFQVFSF